MYDNPTPPPDAEALSEYRFAFHGSTGEYFKIWLVNLLLSLITLGIFSAWAKVRSKRYFYGNTTLNGFSFDYHASPITILVSRLLIIAFVFGVAALAVWSGDILSDWGGERLTKDVPVNTPVFILLLYFLLPWALVRGFSFHARYSSYCGVRFHFNKTYAKIYWIFAPALILELVINLAFIFTPMNFETPEGTAGFLLIGVASFLFFLVLPVSVRAFYRFKTVHHAWGNAPFGYDAPSLIKFAAPMIGLLGIFLIIPLAGYAVFAGATEVDQTGARYERHIELLVDFSYAGLYLGPLFLAAYLLRLYWRSVRVGGGAIQCDFSATGYCFKILFINTLAIILSLGLLYPWTKVRRARFLADGMRLFVPTAAMNSVTKGSNKKEDALGEELDSVEGFDFDVGLI